MVRRFVGYRGIAATRYVCLFRVATFSRRGFRRSENRTSHYVSFRPQYRGARFGNGPNGRALVQYIWTDDSHAAIWHVAPGTAKANVYVRPILSACNLFGNHALFLGLVCSVLAAACSLEGMGNDGWA